MNGLLILNKPGGLTSHDCVSRIRRLFNTRKVGHAGTLDPLATGVLPIAVGEATKTLQFLLAEDKSYRATFRLGVTTDTLDREGEVIEQRPVPTGYAERLAEICQRFTGELDQLPPMYSALKKDGIPLYKLARKGIEVTREPRRITIYKLDLIAVEDDQVTIEVACSKGTYIRSLASDIGEVLGCGAHITALQRLRTGDFTIAESYSLEQLEHVETRNQSLLSLNDALRSYPAARLNQQAARQLGFGIPPELNAVTITGTSFEPGNIVRLLADDELAAMARFAPDRENEKRGDFELIRVLNGAVN